jgi:diacylglycerol O-acyltransferase
MTPMDRAFFLLETEQRPMNVGVLMVVAPARRAGRGRPSDELVRRMLRCPVGPPFNHVLGPGRWPTLVERRHVDPAEQLFRHQLPAGSELSALYTRVCTLHSRRLDRARPLWEMHVFDGLARGRVGLYFKTHHGLVDGLGFLRIIRGIVSPRAGNRAPQAIWRGLPAAGDGLDALPGKPAADPSPVVVSPWSRRLATARTVNDLGRLLVRLGLRDLRLGDGLALPFIGTPNVLKAPPSPNRVLGHCTVPLAQVRAVANAGGAKVNDVLLAMLDLALSRYLTRRGMPPARPLVADMPVALRDDSGAGNRITILQVPLGRPGATPAQRLADVVRETRAVKRQCGELTPDALFFYSIFGHALASAIEMFNLGELPMLANLVVSNPTGLDRPVHFNGVPVELALPVSVVAHHQTLNVTVTNYGATLHVTFIALREALPDVQRLADAAVVALQDLARDVGGRTDEVRAARTVRSKSATARARSRPVLQ